MSDIKTVKVLGTICPICSETHAEDRGLSFDGFGINSCDQYRSRMLKFVVDPTGLTFGYRGRDQLGHLFAEAPALEKALREIVSQLSEPANATHTLGAFCLGAGIAATRAVLRRIDMAQDGWDVREHTDKGFFWINVRRRAVSPADTVFSTADQAWAAAEAYAEQLQ